jgi:hypothetical protein
MSKSDGRRRRAKRFGLPNFPKSRAMKLRLF